MGLLDDAIQSTQAADALAAEKARAQELFGRGWIVETLTTPSVQDVVADFCGRLTASDGVEGFAVEHPWGERSFHMVPVFQPQAGIIDNARAVGRHRKRLDAIGRVATPARVLLVESRDAEGGPGDIAFAHTRTEGWFAASPWKHWSGFSWWSLSAEQLAAVFARHLMSR